MIDKLFLLSGEDLPFIGGQVNIHQPTLKEIALMGELNFFIGCQTLIFTKKLLSTEEQEQLGEVNDFDLFLAILSKKEALQQKLNVFMIFSLLFPEYEVSFEEEQFVFKKEEENFEINRNNFAEFQKIIVKMFNLQPSPEEFEYNPKGKKAKEIADKLKKGRETLAKIKAATSEKEVTTVLERQVSILAIGLQVSLDTFLNYTVYQLNDQFQRYQLKQMYDFNLKARLAGATDLEEPESWMESFRS